MSKLRFLSGLLALAALLVSLGGCVGQDRPNEQTANPAATPFPTAAPTGTPPISAVPGHFHGCPLEGTTLLA